MWFERRSINRNLWQCSHLVPGHRARVLFYAGHQCEHTFFPGTHARIRARCRCPSTRSRPCTRALNWALSPCVNTFFVGALALYPQTTCFRTHNSLSHSRFQNGVRRCKVEFNSERVLCLLNMNISSDWVLCVWTQHHFVPVPGY